MEENTIVIKQEGFDGDNSSLVLEEMDTVYIKEEVQDVLPSDAEYSSHVLEEMHTVYIKEEVQDVLPSDAELLEVSCIPHVKYIKITFHALQQN